jgi:hypothetical protein
MPIECRAWKCAEDQRVRTSGAVLCIRTLAVRGGISAASPGGTLNRSTIFAIDGRMGNQERAAAEREMFSDASDD